MLRSLLAALGCALALTGCSAMAREPSRSSSAYTVLQMNLCLSGLAGCYGKVAYPAVVDEAVARIRDARPDAVTFNEACGGDAGAIARRTGYRMRFSTVNYLGKRLHCVRPGGRGLFGDAVLTKAPIVRSDNRPFTGQDGIERRGWLCVTTKADVDVCTAHLNTRTSVEVTGNDAQCAELKALLAHRAADHAVLFAGDVNRDDSCAPHGFWTRTDSSARQAPGLQHVYGSARLRSPSAAVVPAAHTDHDALLVHASVDTG
jgi:endonuclease/exonuclease/phosphatase family metal-dependent hydrolase